MNPFMADEAGHVHLEEIAAEYQRKGYDVQVEPRLDQLPDFLAGFEPDLIAIGHGESIVVEVRTKRELADASFAAELEAVMQDRPGWRFELIIDGTIADQRQTLAVSQIRALLEESAVLERQKHSAAALMVLWSAIEGALRLLARREKVELESLQPEYLLTRLYTLGLLGREQYWTLDGTMRKRASAAHGYQVALKPEDLHDTASALKELLQEVEMKAA